VQSNIIWNIINHKLIHVKILNVLPRSLMRWVNRYIIEKSVNRHNRKSISYKVRKIHVKFLIKEIIKNKTITMEDLLIKLKENFKCTSKKFNEMG